MSETPIADEVAWRVRLDHAVASLRPGRSVDDVALNLHIDVDSLEAAVAVWRQQSGSARLVMYGNALQQAWKVVPMQPSTPAARDGLLQTWRAALEPLGFEEREKPAGEYRWRRETTGLKMTLNVGVNTLGFVGSPDVPSDLIMVRVGWSVSARDGKRWLRVDHFGRTLFPSDVQGDIWHLHDGVATTQFSGWDVDVLDQLRSLGSTFAGFATELSDRTTARRFVLALQHTRVDA